MKTKLQRKKPQKGQSEAKSGKPQTGDGDAARQLVQRGLIDLKAGARRERPECQTPTVWPDVEPGVIQTEVYGNPSPEVVAEAARAEPNVKLVEDYAQAIRILRDEKRLTFREIAEWLKKRFDIETDHNAVYRVYTKGMHEMDAAMAAVADEEDERDAT